LDFKLPQETVLVDEKSQNLAIKGFEDPFGNKWMSAIYHKNKDD